MYESIVEIKSKSVLDQDRFIFLNESILNEIQNHLKESGEFIDKNDIQGECLLNLCRYKEALTAFLLNKNFKKCGKICLENLKEYSQAFDYFNMIPDYSLAIEALIYMKDYKKLFDYVIINSELMDAYTFTSFFQRYSCTYFKEFIFLPLPRDACSLSIIRSRELEPLKIVFFYSYLKHSGLENENVSLNKYHSKAKDDSAILGINSFKDSGVYKSNTPCPYIHFNESNFLIINQSNLDSRFNLTRNHTVISKIKKKYCILFNHIYNYIRIIAQKSKEHIMVNKMEAFVNHFNLLPSDYVNEYSIVDVNDLQVIQRALSDLCQNEMMIQHQVEISLFKTVSYLCFIQNFPSLIIWKLQEKTISIKKLIKSACFLRNRKDLKRYQEENISQVCECLRQSLLVEDDIKRKISIIFILMGYYENALLLFSEHVQLYISAMMKKSKLFHSLLNSLKISFVSYMSSSMIDYNNLFTFCSFLQINLLKFIKYFRQVNETKIYDENAYRKMEDHLQNLSPYRRLFNILSTVKSDNYCYQYGVLDYFKKFETFLSNPDGFQSNESLYEMIEIGTAISLYIFLYGSSTKLEMSYPNNYVTSYEITKNLISFFISIKRFLMSVKYFRKSNVMDTSSNNFYSLERLVLYSLFSAFGISVLPNIKELEIYRKFCFMTLHVNSPIFFNEEKVGYTSKAYASNKVNKVKFLKSKIKGVLDSTGKIFIINVKTAFKIFHEYSFCFCKKLYHCCYYNIVYPKDIVSNFYNLNQSITFFDLKHQLVAIKHISKFKTTFSEKFFNNLMYFLKNFKLDEMNNSFDEEFLTRDEHYFMTIIFSISQFPLGIESTDEKIDESNIHYLKYFIDLIQVGLTKKLEENQHNNELVSYALNIFLISFLFAEQSEANLSICNIGIDNITESNDEELITSLKFQYRNLKSREDQIDFYYNIIQIILDNMKRISPIIILVYIRKLFPAVKNFISLLTNATFSAYSSRMELSYANMESIPEFNIDFALMKKSVSVYFQCLNHFMNDYLLDSHDVPKGYPIDIKSLIVDSTKNNHKKQNLKTPESQSKKRKTFSWTLQFSELVIYEIYCSIIDYYSQELKEKNSIESREIDDLFTQFFFNYQRTSSYFDSHKAFYLDQPFANIFYFYFLNKANDIKATKIYLHKVKEIDSLNSKVICNCQHNREDSEDHFNEESEYPIFDIFQHKPKPGQHPELFQLFFEGFKDETAFLNSFQVIMEKYQLC